MPALAALLAALVVAAPERVPPERTDPTPPREVLRALAVAAAGEPDVARVQSAAARRAGSHAPRRSALSALLPKVTAEVRHDEQTNRVVGLQGSGEVDYLRLTPGTSVALRATWDLARLVAAPEPGAAERARWREEAVRRATQLYYERRQLRVALLLAPPEDPAARADAELEIDRLGAELDALTGGLFSGERP